MADLTDAQVDTLDRDVRNITAQLALATDQFDAAVAEHEGDLAEAATRAASQLRAAVATLQGPDFAALEEIAAARRG